MTNKEPTLHVNEQHEWSDDYYRLATDFLMTKILQLYLIMDSPNFIRNQQHLAEEMEIYIRNHKND